MPFGPEELFPEDISGFAESKGWLEDRSNPLFIYKFASRDVTFDDHLKGLLPEEHFRRLALKKVKLENKEEWPTTLQAFQRRRRKRVLEGVKATVEVEECLKQLDLV